MTTSCVTNRSFNVSFSFSALSSEYTQCSYGKTTESCGEISTRSPRALGSLLKHSGGFVSIIHCFRGPLAPQRLNPCQPVPHTWPPAAGPAIPGSIDSVCSNRRRVIDQIQRQRGVARTQHVLAQGSFIRGENADSFPATGNCHVPLAAVRGGAHGRIGEKDVIH